MTVTARADTGAVTVAGMTGDLVALAAAATGLTVLADPIKAPTVPGGFVSPPTFRYDGPAGPLAVEVRWEIGLTVAASEGAWERLGVLAEWTLAALRDSPQPWEIVEAGPVTYDNLPGFRIALVAALPASIHPTRPPPFAWSIDPDPFVASGALACTVSSVVPPPTVHTLTAHLAAGDALTAAATVSRRLTPAPLTAAGLLTAHVVDVKWSPALLPGLVAWFDADDPATITAAAGKVSSWANKAPGGVAVVQPTAALQPTTGTRTLNGRNVLDFPGPSAGLAMLAFSGANPMAAAAAGTAYHVAACDTVGTGGGVIGWWSSAGGGSHFPYNDGNIYDNFGSTTRHTIGGRTGFAAPHVYGSLSAPNDWRAYWDGAQVFSTPTNTVGWATSNFPASDATCIGNADGWSGTFSYDGRIAEVVVCNVALTDPDRLALEGYLKTRWGTP